MQTVLTAETDKTVLSGKCLIRKTEKLIKDTARVLDLDILLSKLAEAVILRLDELKALTAKVAAADCVKAVTKDGKHAVFFRFGSQLNSAEVSPSDIIFFRYESSEGEFLRNDLRVTGYLAAHKTVDFIITPTTLLPSEKDFSKLYRLTNASGVNFPLLNAEQRALVELEDRNVLVQGAAGSGKTNVCVDKIVFAACREYVGKVLYTTFSRGLLIDTKNRLDIFRRNLTRFVEEYDAGKVIFADKYRKKAVENKLGVYIGADDEENIVAKIKRIADFLTSRVDYMLIADIYAAKTGKTPTVANEDYFIKYLANPKNRLYGRLEKLKQYPAEVLYKELYGMLSGWGDPTDYSKTPTAESYAALRGSGFSRQECEVIWSLYRDYYAHLAKNGLTDNNAMSRELLTSGAELCDYSLLIADEVQDMTQINLCLLKALCRRMFCVGDALQMINPSYFSFAYLKRLLFRKEISSAAAELTHNYRSAAKIADIINGLGELNASVFGTHSFVLQGKSVDSEAKACTAFVRERGFAEKVAAENFDNFTLIVGSAAKKEKLRKLFKRQEILTVSEVKGLERETVILYDLLSDNKREWEALTRSSVNRKTADENSVYRYYFNLFYVGVSRARVNLFVSESAEIPLFNGFFKSFEPMTAEQAFNSLTAVVDKPELDQDELMERVEQFLKLGQYGNARFSAEKLTDDRTRMRQLTRVDIYERLVNKGEYRRAGVELWEKGIIEEAKRMFVMSGDEQLIQLLDATSAEEGTGLNGDVVRFYGDLEQNGEARRLIAETVKEEALRLLNDNRAIAAKLKKKKEKNNG